MASNRQETDPNQEILAYLQNILYETPDVEKPFLFDLLTLLGIIGKWAFSPKLLASVFSKQQELLDKYLKQLELYQVITSGGTEDNAHFTQHELAHNAVTLIAKPFSDFVEKQNIGYITQYKRISRLYDLLLGYYLSVFPKDFHSARQQKISKEHQRCSAPVEVLFVANEDLEKFKDNYKTYKAAFFYQCDQLMKSFLLYLLFLKKDTDKFHQMTENTFKYYCGKMEDVHLEIIEFAEEGAAYFLKTKEYDLALQVLSPIMVNCINLNNTSHLSLVFKLFQKFALLTLLKAKNKTPAQYYEGLAYVAKIGQLLKNTNAADPFYAANSVFNELKGIIDEHKPVQNPNLHHYSAGLIFQFYTLYMDATHAEKIEKYQQIIQIYIDIIKKLNKDIQPSLVALCYHEIGVTYRLQALLKLDCESSLKCSNLFFAKALELQKKHQLSIAITFAEQAITQSALAKVMIDKSSGKSEQSHSIDKIVQPYLARIGFFANHDESDIPRASIPEVFKLSM